jgi:hypothetical protein
MKNLFYRLLVNHLYNNIIVSHCGQLGPQGSLLPVVTGLNPVAGRACS